ncbi:MAG: CaiB/BaiF CoA-transferase family protein [Proteobacteria bacterium]|nr:CaiB/BaiF CoA-transferase family protein [Pseudomonadota bacterium]
MAFPLKGIKVLDMSRVLAGPFAGRMLCDLGADVVKLEPPEGDITRMWGRKVAGISGYYHQQNAGKRNISVDLRSPLGAQLVKALVEQADVLIENFRPDVMGRLGLDYPTLERINPRLIMLSISGFGKNNADSRRAAYAPVIHAETGLVHRQAFISNAFPAEMALSIADTNASLHGLVALLAALFARVSSGHGEHIDLAMVDATVVTNDGMHVALDGGKQLVTNEVHETAAGLLMLAGEFRFIWSQLSKVFGLSDGLTGEPALEEKISARRAASKYFFTVTCRDRKGVIEALDKMNIAWGDVRPASDISKLASVQARKTITQIDDRDGGTRPTTQSPYHFLHYEARVQGGAPHLGEHNSVVLSDWLGWDEQRISEYQPILVS